MKKMIFYFNRKAIKKVTIKANSFRYDRIGDRMIITDFLTGARIQSFKMPRYFSYMNVEG